MLDFVEIHKKTYNERRMIENLTGKTFNPDLNLNYISLTLHPAQTCCGDQELMSFPDIAFLRINDHLVAGSHLWILQAIECVHDGRKVGIEW